MEQIRELKSQINNDWTIRYEGRLYQLKAQNTLPPAKNKARVRKRLYDSMQILYRPLGYKEISSRLVVVHKEVIKPMTNWKPAPDHPWRSYRKNIQDEMVQSAAAARGTIPLALTP